MGKWEMATFSDVIDDITRLATKIKKEDYLAEGRYQIVDQGKKDVAGYTNDPNGMFIDVPVIVFGDHTRVIKYVDSPLFIGADGVKLLKVKRNDFDTKFVFYYLSSCNIIDTGYNRHFKWLKEFNIPHPPQPIQKKIADVLDRASVLIEKRKAQIDKLDLLIKSQFIEMFGDPVTNPNDFETVKLSRISSSRLGKMLDEKQQIGLNKYQYLANFNVQWFRFELSKVNEMDFNEADQLEFEIRKGDLLVCEGGEVGRCAIWNEELQNCFFQKAIHRVRCDTDKIIPEYLSWWFYFRSHYNRFEDIVGKATIAHLTGIRLKNLNIMLPPLYLQKRFSEYCYVTEVQKRLLVQSLEKLRQEYKALIQRCFRGEVFK